MEKRTFHFSVILSIATERFFSLNGFKEYQECIEFLVDNNVHVQQLGRVGRECKPFMCAQFPWFASGEMQFALGEIKLMLDATKGKEERINLLVGWLSKIQCGKYGAHNLPLCGEGGDMLEVSPIPKDAHERVRPLAEMLETVDPHRIILV